MCGRLSQNTAAEKTEAVLQIINHLELAPRFNVAPSQPLAAVRQNAAGQNEWALLRWGLLPHWAKDPKIAYKMINAKAETLAEKPSFRSAYRARRCLIPADGFYEWRKEDNHKQPYYIRPRDEGIFLFAGLWERWEAPGQRVESCTIVTTRANALLERLHDRMPVIIDARDAATWLDADLHETRVLDSLLKPSPPDGITAYPVTPKVNKPAYDEPDCIAPLA